MRAASLDTKPTSAGAEEAVKFSNPRARVFSLNAKRARARATTRSSAKDIMQVKLSELALGVEP